MSSLAPRVRLSLIVGASAALLAVAVLAWSPWQGEIWKLYVTQLTGCTYDDEDGAVETRWLVEGEAEGATTFTLRVDVVSRHDSESPAASAETDVRVPDGSFEQTVTTSVPLAREQWDAGYRLCSSNADL